MKLSFGRKTSIVALILGVNGCSHEQAVEGVTSENVAEVGSALQEQSHGILPYPAKTEAGRAVRNPDGTMTVGWTRSMAELMLADAYGACAYDRVTDPGANDGYLVALREDMARLSCGVSRGKFIADNWYRQRKDSECNVDSSSGAGKAAALPEHSAYELKPAAFSAPDDATLDKAVDAAVGEIEVADFNLCLAQYLRENTVTATGLLLSASDQRELLEMIRERAQVAMLQYGLLGIAFSDSVSGTDDIRDWREYLSILHAVASRPDNANTLEQMGRDFAAAIELHSDITQELAELLVRSASARLDRGGSAVNDADKEWGKGAWRRRLLMLLYGGDPLMGLPGARGKNYVGITGAGDPLSNAAVVTEDVRSPEVVELLGLARAADALYFKTTLESGHSGDLRGIDEQASADRLYAAVEASLRHPECTRRSGTDSSGTTCEELSGVAVVPAGELPLLESRYRITRGHALSLVRQLTQAMPRVGDRMESWTRPGTFIVGDDVRGALRFTGKHELLQEAVVTQRLPGTNGVWYHLDKEFTAVPFGVAQLAGPYLTDYLSPRLINRHMVPWLQGYVALWKADGSTDLNDPAVNGNARMRVLGSISALSATRDNIVTGLMQLSRRPSPNAQKFYGSASAALGLVATAVGQRTVAVRPELAQASIYSSCAEWGDPATQWCPVLAQVKEGNKIRWQVAVTAPSGDAFKTLVVARRGYGDASLAELGLTNRSFSGVDAKSYLDGEAKFETAWEEKVGTTGLVRRVYRIALDPEIGTQALEPSLFVAKTENGTVTAATQIGDNLRLTWTQQRAPIYSENAGDTSVPGTLYTSRAGKYLGFGGVLGTVAQQAWAVQSYNWSRPAYDGFGLPTDYVPDVDAGLLGAGAGYSADHYLSLAEAAAHDATNMTKEAIEALIRQESDDRLADDARRRGARLIQNEYETLCSSSSCDLSRERVNVRQSIQAEGLVEPIRSIASGLPRYVSVLRPVSQHLGDSSAPDFSREYGSGGLKVAADAQWDAFRKAKDLVIEANKASRSTTDQITEAMAGVKLADDALVSATKVRDEKKKALDEAHLDLDAGNQAYQKELEAANAALNAAKAKAQRECDNDALNHALRSGKSYSCDEPDDMTISFDPNSGPQYYCSDTTGVGFSMGPYIAQVKLCVDSRAAIPVAQAQLEATRARKPSTANLNAVQVGYVEALEGITAAIAQQAVASARVGSATSSQAERYHQLISKAHEVGIKLRQSEGEAGQAVQQASHNLAKITLEAQATEGQLVTRFGTYRRYHSSEVERARRAIETARKQGVRARRALEARFVIDLSAMRTREFTGEPPATWADTIYEYDLDLKSATGLRFLPQPNPGDGSPVGGPLDAQKITEYVQSVKQVRNNFFVNRPTQSAKNDAELINFPGPGAIVEAEGPDGEYRSETDDRATRWVFYCAADHSWISHPAIERPEATNTLSTACKGNPPDRARYVFTLDPWGMPEGDVAHPPLEAPKYRHNARWTKLALNLTGSGVLNCGSDPDCVASQSVRFNLTHLGPAWVADRDLAWRILAFPEGHMEWGKAAAAGYFITEVSNSWNAPWVQNIARSEFYERPLGGVYELELLAGPRVKLDNIRQVQLLTMLEYWIKTGLN